MTLPLYENAAGRLEDRGNLGLWYTRFFDRYDSGWTLEDDAKRGWIQRAVGAAERRSGDPDLKAHLEQLSHRRIDLVRSCGGDLLERRTRWHFVTGLGLPHPVENGFAWHPTLGLPYLPATGVKGLLAAWLYAREHDEDESTEARQEAQRRRRAWCGIQDDAGQLIFFDALPAEPPKLLADVMTPHLGKWYAEGGSISSPAGEPEKVPADWHSPVPVPFLVVEQATFLFAVAPRPGADWQGLDPAAEVAAALEELGLALSELGAGAKTAVGYGRFDAARSHYAKIEEAEAERAKEQAQADQRAARLARFEGFEPPIAEVLGPTGLKGLTTVVLKAMAQGTWPDEDRPRLAAALKGWLQEREEWVEDAPAKASRARRDRKIRNTLEVMRWLGHS